MESRVLGRTERPVSVVGLGTWQLGAGWGEVTEHDAYAVLSAAVEAGVDVFDTADVYGDGRSEQLIGSFLAEHPEPRVMVATKMGRRVEQVPESYTLQNFRAWTDRSRRNLATDRLDEYAIASVWERGNAALERCEEFFGPIYDSVRIEFERKRVNEKAALAETRRIEKEWDGIREMVKPFLETSAKVRETLARAAMRQSGNAMPKANHQSAPARPEVAVARPAASAMKNLSTVPAVAPTAIEARARPPRTPSKTPGRARRAASPVNSANNTRRDTPTARSRPISRRRRATEKLTVV